MGPMTPEIEKSDQAWKTELSSEQYYVLREGGTERAFTGKFVDLHDDGSFRCAGCDAVLFDSETKFDSGSGWPSFTQPAAGDVVELVDDTSQGMVRTEVRCKRCGGHLGHVFDDGPGPTGQRWCINSAALEFEPKD